MPIFGLLSGTHLLKTAHACWPLFEDISKQFLKNKPDFYYLKILTKTFCSVATQHTANSSSINLFKCGVMPLPDGSRGRGNRFYSIGVFWMVVGGQLLLLHGWPVWLVGVFVMDLLSDQELAQSRQRPLLKDSLRQNSILGEEQFYWSNNCIYIICNCNVNLRISLTSK